MLTVDNIDWEGEVPLDAVMRYWVPAYPNGGTWEDTIRVLAKCPGERIIVDTLRAELRESGRFERPIRLYHQPYEVDDGEVYEESWFVGNGTHRVVAAHLEGAETILATREDETDETDFIDVTLSLDISGSDPTCSPEESDQLDFVSDYLHSFRLDDETWVESPIASGSDTVSIGYECPWDKREALVAKVLDLCDEHGAKAELISVELFSTDEDDE